MCKPSWPDCLDQTLNSLKSPDRPAKIAILGIGQELRGDDAAGVAVARALRSLRLEHSPESDLPYDTLIIEAGPSASNFTGTLRHFAPHLVILIDAAWLDKPPGTIHYLDWRTASGLSATTHTLPLSLFGDYVTVELGCRILLVGIQPAQTDVDAPLSPAVEEAVARTVRSLRQRLFVR